MGRSRAAKKRRGEYVRATPREPTPTGLDATPERIAKGESELVVALIEKAGERPGKARQFRSSHLDRLHRNGKLTYRQWLAGDWYRSTHDRCRFSLSVVSSYGERTGAGDHPGSFGYGLPRQEAQARARDDLRNARQQWSPAMQGFMGRLLVHDDLPRYGGRRAMHALTDIRSALDRLAEHLRM